MNSNYVMYVVIIVILYVLTNGYYLFISAGLSNKAKYLQMRRFIPCAILPVIPLAVANITNLPLALFVSVAVGVLWAITYPTIYFATNHKVSPEFSYHLDFVFGLYITCLLFCLKLLGAVLGPLQTFWLFAITLGEIILLAIPLIELGYYIFYGVCMDNNTMALVQMTYFSEVVEYFNSIPLSFKIAIFPMIAIVLAIIFYLNMQLMTWNFTYFGLAIMIGLSLFLVCYLFKPSPRKSRKDFNSIWRRTGIVELWLDEKEYLEQTASYASKKQEMLQSFAIKAKCKYADKPATFIFVIGESESKDYMGCYGYDKDTTPWLTEQSKNDNFILFPHAYSCHFQTVPVLTHALTEASQYNNKKFFDSYSFIDVAHKLGFRVHWFSNQSYIGSADTPVTILAQTADTATWVKHDLTKQQVDGALLDFLPTVDPNQNNFIVFHLKGSHFNFIDRYPQSFAKFSEPHKYDMVSNYLDSVRYTDHILQQIFEYGKQHLNLQTMLYFSDHGAEPNAKRSPVFSGFSSLRIPLFVYMSDEYRRVHPHVSEALNNNREKFFTNDLGYELICGLLDVMPECFDEKSCLAANNYKFKLEDLFTSLGQIKIEEDKTLN